MRNITKVYGADQARVRALDGVSFDINRGEIVLVVGSSGSGKSTLLNMMGLLDRPTSGKVLVDGTDTSKLDDGRISVFRNTKLGFVFQFANLLADLDVLGNVALPGRMAGRPDIARAKKLLDAVGLADQARKRPNQISGGQAQRAAIARALMNGPSLVLADEPTGNLDSVSAENVVGLLKSIARKMERAFVIVTHDREQFGNVDRVLVMRDGRLEG